MERKIIVTDLVQKPDGKNKGYYSWHSNLLLEIEDNPYRKLKISDCFGGCGIQTLYNWFSIGNYEDFKLLLDHAIKIRRTDVGAYLCQLGQSYYNKHWEKALINCGFECVSEFKNYRHASNGSYEQKIYILKF